MFDTFIEITTLAADAALLRPAAFEALQQQPRLAIAALVVPFLAGASELLGEAWVLAARKPGRWQVVLSLTTTGAVQVVSAITWGAAAYGLMMLDGLRPPSELAVLGIIAIGYTPRVLSVLAIAPYYGEALDHAMDAWSMACIGVGLWTLGSDQPLAVAAVALLGWLASLVVRRSGGIIGRAVLGLMRKLASLRTAR